MLTTSNIHISGDDLRKIISINIFEKTKKTSKYILKTKNNCIIAKKSRKKIKNTNSQEKKMKKNIKIQIIKKNHEKMKKSKKIYKQKQD